MARLIRRTWRYCLAALILLSGGACQSLDLPVEKLPLRPATAKLSPGLQVTENEDEVVTVMVDLREQLDLRRFAQQRARRSRQKQGAEVREALAAISQRSDRIFRPLLEGLRRRGLVQSWSHLTIVNRLIITGRLGVVRQLAERSEVAAIFEEIRGEDALLSSQTEPAAPADGWPLDVLGVRSLHERGLDGRGVVVGLIDSGASNQHETLRENFRGAANSWFDPLRNTAIPIDSQIGHGTSVLSCAVGRSGGEAFGAAPGAAWIAAVGFEARRYHNVALAKAADWMLNVGRPDVLIAPWRLPENCDPSLRRIVETWRMAGILVVFAAGNSGPDAGTDVAPANYVGLWPDSHPVLSVGAIAKDLQIYEQSSRGPNHCGQDVFPQMVAPGAEVPVALPLSASLYRRASGTSFAAGYAAGAIALVLQRFSDTPVEWIEEAFRQTATDLGAPGTDPSYGYGLLNAAEAIRWLESHSNALHRKRTL